jgi:hypothetical protein
MKLFGQKTNFSEIYKNSFKPIVEKISKKYKTPSAYLQFLLWLSEKINVTTNTKLIDELRQHFRKSKEKEKVTSRAERSVVDETVDYEKMYHDLFQRETDLSKTEQGSQKHLLSVIYSRALYSDDKARKKILVLLPGSVRSSRRINSAV